VNTSAQKSSNAGPVTAGVLVIGGLVYGSDRLMDFLGTWEEGSRRQLVVYADKLAGGLPTVCKGLTRHVTLTPIVVGERWTEEKCNREERAAVIVVQHQLRPCFKLTPPQAVFDTGTSHAWNLGARRTCGSQAMAAWNTGNWTLGCRRLLQSDGGKFVWVYAGGVFVPGLKNRRTAERNWCMEAAK